MHHLNVVRYEILQRIEESRRKRYSRGLNKCDTPLRSTLQRKESSANTQCAVDLGLQLVVNAASC
jgi:hypothetical protein